MLCKICVQQPNRKIKIFPFLSFIYFQISFNQIYLRSINTSVYLVKYFSVNVKYPARYIEHKNRGGKNTRLIDTQCEGSRQPLETVSRKTLHFQTDFQDS